MYHAVLELFEVHVPTFTDQTYSIGCSNFVFTYPQRLSTILTRQIQGLTPF